MRPRKKKKACARCGKMVPPETKMREHKWCRDCWEAIRDYRNDTAV